jgi:hypothetical protein
MMGFIILHCIKYYWNDQVKEDEMERVCSTHEEENECVKDFRGKARRKET